MHRILVRHVQWVFDSHKWLLVAESKYTVNVQELHRTLEQKLIENNDALPHLQHGDVEYILQQQVIFFIFIFG